ncbi:hypothetical protein [Marininema halotolerans]|uniref:Uncharacterized protein n=1 Tax=Marininema halotolerans TaxID=1155944 RepID=A0A1I6URP0_9BACL|nr:hypothetical protein [Marininema halotolerans]SFT04118.1 hypothetical protein SAMN05444972_11940 [Marininema halotolerans]
MKKYKVTSAFIDRHTRVEYAVGDVYEAGPKRAEELQGFLGSEVPEKKPQKKAK